LNTGQGDTFNPPKGDRGLETGNPLTYSDRVKQILRLYLPTSISRWIDGVRGEMDSADYIVSLLEQHMEQNRRATEERNRWLAEGRAQYTDQVCRQTLEINEEFPIHDE